MKINIRVLALIVLFICFGCTYQGSLNTKADIDQVVENTLYFDPNKSTIISGECGGNRIIPNNLDELEKAVYNYENGVIVQCTVAGPSINRIIEPTESERVPAKIYGENHVLTPVKIINIYYKGENVSINEGSIINLAEPFFYVSEETSTYLDYYPIGTIIADEYYPIEKEKTYVMFLKYSSSEIYDYEGKPVLSTIGLGEAVYCVDEENLEYKENISCYDKVYCEVKEKYFD